MRAETERPSSWDYVNALEFGKAIQDLGFLWYEEPMREFHLGAYIKLCEKLDIPVLAAETSDGVGKQPELAYERFPRKSSGCVAEGDDAVDLRRRERDVAARPLPLKEFARIVQNAE